MNLVNIEKPDFRVGTQPWDSQGVESVLASGPLSRGPQGHQEDPPGVELCSIVNSAITRDTDIPILLSGVKPS